MRLTLLTVALVIMASAQDYDAWKSCKTELLHRPEVFAVQGKATKYLQPKIGIVQFNLEALRQTAGEALAECNSQLQMAVEYSLLIHYLPGHSSPPTWC